MGYIALFFSEMALVLAATLVPTTLTALKLRGLWALIALALATVPLALARRGAARGYAVFLAVLPPFLVFALRWGGFLQSLAYQADRGLQVESLAASILMKLSPVNEVFLAYGVFELRGQGVEFAASLSLPLVGTLLLVTAFFMHREYRSGRYGLGTSYATRRRLYWRSCSAPRFTRRRT
jgi:hypothetical protein